MLTILRKSVSYFRIGGDLAMMYYLIMAFMAGIWMIGVAQLGWSEHAAKWSAITIFVGLMITVPPLFRAMDVGKERSGE